MEKKFEVNRTKIKGACQSYTKAAPRESWRDLTMAISLETNFDFFFHEWKVIHNSAFLVRGSSRQAE